jgi:toxin YoeB
MIKAWTDDAWRDYLWWQEHDAKTLRRINSLVRDIERSPFSGIGKPEPLRHDLSGMWSRRIDATNRLVYSVEGKTLTIYSAKDHY